MAKYKPVNKQMSPEELANIQAIQGICSEILGASTVEEAPDPPNTPQKTEEEQENGNSVMASQLRKMADEIDKACTTPPEKPVEKASQGPTANESGEERLMTNTEINDNNMSEVGKALFQQLRKSMIQNPPVQTSPVNNNAEVAKLVVQGLAPVLKSMQERQDAQDTALMNVFDALGASESVLKSLETSEQRTPDVRPVTSQDAGLFFAEMMQVMKSQGTGSQPSQPVRKMSGYGDIETLQKSQNETRKDLITAMGHIFPGIKLSEGK